MIDLTHQIDLRGCLVCPAWSPGQYMRYLSERRKLGTKHKFNSALQVNSSDKLYRWCHVSKLVGDDWGRGWGMPWQALIIVINYHGTVLFYRRISYSACLSSLNLLNCLATWCHNWMCSFLLGTVKSTNSAANPKCGDTYTYSLPVGEGKSFFCHPSLEGRYVVIRLLNNKLEKPTPLTLCEVEVYAERRGMMHVDL